MFHFSEECSGISSISGYPAMTPRAPALKAETHGERKVSRRLRSETSMAPRSIPLAGTLWVGKSVISATTLSRLSIFEP